MVAHTFYPSNGEKGEGRWISVNSRSVLSTTRVLDCGEGTKISIKHFYWKPKSSFLCLCQQVPGFFFGNNVTASLLYLTRLKKKKEQPHTRRELSWGLYSEMLCCKVTMFLAMLVQGPQMLRVTGELLLWTQCLTTPFLQASALFNVFFLPPNFKSFGIPGVSKYISL